MRRTLTLAVSLSALLIAALAQGQNTTALIAGVFTPQRLAPDFSIVGSNGGELKLSHYRGKVVLLSFGYSHCTAVCPVTLAVLANARKKLGSLGNDVQVVYVTVDPERDDAERMHAFLNAFDSSFVGGTGTPAQLAGVRASYGISATKVPTPDGYMMSHTSYVYLIDRNGYLCGLMPFGHTADDYVHDLSVLLRK
ncbi:MAG TPA: SCO family protein [Steroidobacteraceae bacterium]|jgi:protein SCO1/2